MYAARRCTTGRTLPASSYTSAHLRPASSFARRPRPSDTASTASARAAWRARDRATRNAWRIWLGDKTAARPVVPGGRPRLRFLVVIIMVGVAGYGVV